MRQSCAIAALVTLAIAVGCAAPPGPSLPGPILGLDDRRATRSAILEGMAVRGWLVEQETGGRVLARLHRRTHVAKVWIDYTGEQIQFSYGGSEGLQCQPAGESCDSIHPNYNRWARNLALDIARRLTERRALQEPPGAP